MHQSKIETSIKNEKSSYFRERFRNRNSCRKYQKSGIRFYKTDISGEKISRERPGTCYCKEIIQAHNEHINVISTEKGVEQSSSLPCHSQKRSTVITDRTSFSVNGKFLILPVIHTAIHLCIYAFTYPETIYFLLPWHLPAADPFQTDTLPLSQPADRYAVVSAKGLSFLCLRLFYVFFLLLWLLIYHPAGNGTGT